MESLFIQLSCDAEISISKKIDTWDKLVLWSRVTFRVNISSAESLRESIPKNDSLTISSTNNLFTQMIHSQTTQAIFSQYDLKTRDTSMTFNFTNFHFNIYSKNAFGCPRS